MPAAGAAASTGYFEAATPAPLGEGARGGGDEENGSPGCPRTNALDLVHTLGYPLWEVYEAFSRTRGL